MRIVFAGPSLFNTNLDRYASINFAPPIKQGDIITAVKRGATCIGIVDGVFEHYPAIWHKEIIYALSLGIPVYGSSSIGALRAAECNSYGMQGVGEVYKLYRRGVFEDDDLVALLHGPKETNYIPLSEPYVNMYFTLKEALRKNIISEECQVNMLRIAKKVFFKHRTYEYIAKKSISRDDDRIIFRNWVENNGVNQKKIDALKLVSVLSSLSVDKAPNHIRPSPPDTVHWLKLLDEHV